MQFTAKQESNMSNSISFGTRLLQCLERFYFAWALRYLAAYIQKKNEEVSNLIITHVAQGGYYPNNVLIITYVSFLGWTICIDP